MNYGELQDEVLSHRLNDTKYRPFVAAWLNEGQRFIFLQADVRSQQDEEAYVTVANTATLTLPDDFSRFISLRNTTDDDLLAPIALRDFDDSPASSGKPLYYVIVGSQISLYPTPDAAYNLTLRFYRGPTEMENEGDEPDLPEQYHHLLVEFALMRAFAREDDYEAAGYWREQFEADLMKLRGETQHDSFEGPRQLPGSYEDSGWNLSAWY